MATTRQLHQIGEVADRLGLSLRTVRYYEEAGLVSPSQRTEGGFRLYSEDDIARLDLIKQMKPLGFSIQEMRELLEARDAVVSGVAGERDYERAVERLAALSTEAKTKTEELRRQLQRAEDFAARLKRELRRARRQASASASQS
jgi:DNA-binding transcriptional MerR regulator